MFAGHPSLFDMRDECRSQYVFTYKMFDIAQFLLNAYHQRMRALYVKRLSRNCYFYITSLKL